MTKYQVRFTAGAAKELRSLPARLVERIAIKIDALADEPRPDGCKKLKNSQNGYRIRIGDYRVLYTIADGLLVINIICVAHRKEAY